MLRIALVCAALAFVANLALPNGTPVQLSLKSPQAVGRQVMRPAHVTAALPAVVTSGLGRTADRSAPDARAARGSTGTVSEYLMMMLASLGLIALGVATRRRRY